MPWTIYVYLAVFPASLAPLFFVRSRRLYRRIVGAYAAAIVLSLVVFAAWPVTSTALRADLSGLDATSFTTWCLRTVYVLDPPVNLFPSLHLSIAGLAAAGLWKARRTYGLIALVLVGAIGISICTVKQHFILDGAGGLALAAALHAAVIRPFRPEPAEGPPAYSWTGPILYLVFQGLVYLGLYVTYAIE